MRHTAIILVTLTSAIAVLGAPRGFSRDVELIVFGDSLVDTDNFYQLSSAMGSPWPPAEFYWGGRASNGPTFAELTAKELGIPHVNYAMYVPFIRCFTHLRKSQFRSLHAAVPTLWYLVLCDWPLAGDRVAQRDPRLTFET